LADFDWRVSMAEVAADGPFSLFPGVDRVLTVLQEELLLSFEGGAVVTLGAGALPYAFPGDAPCQGAVRGGMVTDLNVMVRRGRFRCAVRRVSPGALRVAGAPWLFVALQPGEVHQAGASWRLEQGDALLGPGNDGADAVTTCPGVEIAVSQGR
jgi:environmental stress-induced protein Ves